MKSAVRAVTFFGLAASAFVSFAAIGLVLLSQSSLTMFSSLLFFGASLIPIYSAYLYASGLRVPAEKVILYATTWLMCIPASFAIGGLIYAIIATESNPDYHGDLGYAVLAASSVFGALVAGPILTIALVRPLAVGRSISERRERVD